jgi:hypothetical protein
MIGKPSRPVRREAERKRTSPRLAPRRSADPSALLHWFRRLRIRWEIRDDIHEAFLSLACGIICWRRLAKLQLC